MKMKRFAMLAASGLMVASLAHVVPAYAAEFSDDEVMGAPQQLTLADNSSTSNRMEAPNENNGAVRNDVLANAPQSTTDTNSTANTAGNEQATPDVASGDDDY